ncbi:hypothetical protein VN97_g170 [Penicillium thymicola]|uniref:Uncharacterized protein n=1 Tax=Penicillium thymicola TaxID=293382 RepID=A0AAI9XD90_PENTH|nr:hypothetical protein VN97_g170 [Penicillium thymicola]
MAIPGLPTRRNTILNTITQNNILDQLINLAKISAFGSPRTMRFSQRLLKVTRNRSPPCKSAIPASCCFGACIQDRKRARRAGLAAVTDAGKRGPLYPQLLPRSRRDGCINISFRQKLQ